MFTKEEKEYLKKAVKKELEDFRKEESTVLTDMSPAFVKGEAEYEEFLKGILKKLEE